MANAHVSDGFFLPQRNKQTLVLHISVFIVLLFLYTRAWNCMECL